MYNTAIITAIITAVITINTGTFRSRKYINIIGLIFQVKYQLIIYKQARADRDISAIIGLLVYLEDHGCNLLF